MRNNLLYQYRSNPTQPFLTMQAILPVGHRALQPEAAAFMAEILNVVAGEGIVPGTRGTWGKFSCRTPGQIERGSGEASGQNAQGLAVGDFNRDGVPDLGVVSFNADTLTILLGNGDGTFLSTSPITILGPAAVAVGHFHDTNILDLAVATKNGNVDVLLVGTAMSASS
jgi:hypothetical protein